MPKLPITFTRVNTKYGKWRAHRNGSLGYGRSKKLAQIDLEDTERLEQLSNSGKRQARSPR